jgi:hypothetical protein
MNCAAELVARWTGMIIGPVWTRGRITPLRFDPTRKMLIYALGGNPKPIICAVCGINIYIVKPPDGIPVVTCGRIKYEKK